MRVRTSVGAVAIALTLAGCGGDDVALDSVADAASKTTAAGSSRVAATTRMEMEALPRPVEIEMDGAVDYERQTGRYSIDMSDMAEALGGEAGDPSLFRGEMIQERLVMYMRLPAMTRGLPGGKEWLKTDLEAAGKSQGIDISQFQQASGGGDPAQFLQYLRGAGRVEERGEEEVRGVQTTRYHAVVKLDDVVENAPAEQREALEKTMRNLERQLETDELPVDVWLDDDGRVRG